MRYNITTTAIVCFLALIMALPLIHYAPLQDHHAKTATRATSDILLVDDSPYKYYYGDGTTPDKGGQGTGTDGTKTEMDYFKAALDANGYTYDTWIVFESYSQQLPALSDMKTYDIIIWFFGNNYDMQYQSQNPFDYEIPRYLDAGGNMLISGNTLAPYISSMSPNFLSNYMHATFPGNTSEKDILGVDGDYISDEMSFSISGGQGMDDNQGDTPILSPKDANAQTIFEARDDALGLRITAATSKLLFLSFNFEAISDTDTQSALMQRVIEYLRGKPTIVHQPLSDTEHVGDPINVTCEVRGEGLNDSAVQLLGIANGTFALNMTRESGTDTFYALIPAQPENTTVRYYIKAMNLAKKVAYHPQSVNVSNNATFHTFFIGPDVKPPVIEPTLIRDTVRTDHYYAYAKVSDNLGVNVSSVAIHYRWAGAVNFTTLTMTLSGQQYKATIPGAPKDTTIEYYFTAHDLANTPNTARYPVGNDTLQFKIVYHRLLLLDNSNSDTILGDYKDSLTNYNYYNWSVADGGYPTDDDLGDYSDIIWIMGSNLPSDSAQLLMATFMNRGGKLLLAGSNILTYDYYDSTPSTANEFATKYFYVATETYFYGSQITGVEDDPIGDGLSLTSNGMWGYGFTGMSMSVTDQAKAFPILTGTQSMYYDTTAADAQVLGVRVEAGTYKAVFISTEISGAAPADFETTMSKILTWLDSPYLVHTPLKDTEDVKGPYQFKAAVTDDDLDDSKVQLHYKIGDASFATKAMYKGAGSEFTVSLAGPNAASDIYYYLTAQDKSAHLTSAPLGATEATLTTLYKFHAGPDVTPPVIVHKRLGDNIQLPGYYINATITDNLGLDAGKVYLYYKVNEAADFSKVSMDSVGLSEFSAQIPTQTKGTTVQYYITATDLASTPNTARAPQDGSYSFTIFDKIPVLILDASISIYNGGGLKDGTTDGTIGPAQETYQRLLDNMGVTYDYIRLEQSIFGDDDIVYDTGSSDGGKTTTTGTRANDTVLTEIDAATLNKYSIVIYIPSLGTNDYDPFMAYLDNGGKMLISSGYFVAMEAMGTTEFVSDYIGVSMKGASQDTKISGVANDPIGDGMDLELSSMGQVTLSADKAYSVECFSFPDGVAGVHVDRNSYKLVCLSFNVEDMTNQTQQAALFERVYNWLSGIPRIITTPYPDTEDTLGPYVVKAAIQDNDIDVNGLELRYSTGGSFTSIKLTSSVEDNYTASIPGQAEGTRIYYYLKVSDLSKNTVTYPSDCLESDLGSLMSFFVGVDTSPPVIAANRLPNSVPKEFFLMYATITDNLAVDLNNTWLYYKPSTATSYSRASFAPTAVPDRYVAAIPGADLAVGSTVAYYVEAQDLARTPNKARLPQATTWEFKIVDKNVLIVSDDGGKGFEQAYVDILAQGGYAYEALNLSAIEEPISGQYLMGFSAVVWFCSSAMTGTISQDDAAAISYYLDRGGNMLLCGNHIAYEAKNIGWNIWGDDDITPGDDDIIPPKPLSTRADPNTGTSSDGTTTGPAGGGSDSGNSSDGKPVPPPADDDVRPPPTDDDVVVDDDVAVDDDTSSTQTFDEWLQTYFKVDYVETGYSEFLSGSKGDPIGDGLAMEINPDDGLYGTFFGKCDLMDARRGASVVFTQDGGKGSNVTGVKFAGDFRTVFMSFDIHDITNATMAATTLTRTVDWLLLGAGNIQDTPPLLTVFDEGRTKVTSRVYNFTVTYSDPENDMPQGGVFCVINGDRYQMTPADIQDIVYSDGKTYFVQLEFETGNEYDYYFETQDANRTATFKFDTKGSGILSTGALIGIIALIFIIVAILLIVAFIFVRNRARKKDGGPKEGQQTGQKEASSPGPTGSEPAKAPPAMASPQQQSPPVTPVAQPGPQPETRPDMSSPEADQLAPAATPAPEALEEAPPALLEPGTAPPGAQATHEKKPGKRKKAKPAPSPGTVAAPPPSQSKCPSCQKMIPIDATQCPHCSEMLGEGLECPKCHSSIGESDKRCPHCGVRFGGA